MMMARRFNCLSVGLFGVAGAVAGAAPSSLFVGDILNVLDVTWPSKRWSQSSALHKTEMVELLLMAVSKSEYRQAVIVEGVACHLFNEYTQLVSGIFLQEMSTYEVCRKMFVSR